MKDYSALLEEIANYGKSEREIGVKFAKNLDLDEAQKLNYEANKRFFEIAKQINELLDQGNNKENVCEN